MLFVRRDVHMRVGMCCTRRAIRRRISVAYQYVWVHNRTLARIYKTSEACVLDCVQTGKFEYRRRISVGHRYSPNSRSRYRYELPDTSVSTLKKRSVGTISRRALCFLELVRTGKVQYYQVNVEFYVLVTTIFLSTILGSVIHHVGNNRIHP